MCQNMSERSFENFEKFEKENLFYQVRERKNRIAIKNRLKNKNSDRMRIDVKMCLTLIRRIIIVSKENCRLQNFSHKN